MQKAKSFDEILNAEFRWPIEGDNPFVVADDPCDNANVVHDELTRLILMTEGYKLAADLMVAASVENQPMRDMVVFPIIFNYRHFLELKLKYHIAIYGPTAYIDPNWKTHCLRELWEKFLDLLDRYGVEDPDEINPVVDKIILEFAKIDPASYSFRYPVDKKGNPIPVSKSVLSLPNLALVMTKVAAYFSGCDGLMSDLRDATAT